MWLALITAAVAMDLTLSQALDGALTQNPELARARLELERSEWALVQARARFDPTLNLGLDASGSSAITNDTLEVPELVNTSTGWSASVTQQLPTGGSASLGWSETTSETNSQLAVQTTSTTDRAFLSVTQPLLDGAGPLAARYGVQSAVLGLSDQELQWRASLEQMVLDVSDAYWGLVAAEESYALAKRSREVAEEQLDETMERLDEGFAGSGDVLQVERAVGVARQSEVIAEAEVDASEDRLARLIGVPLIGREDIAPSDRPAVPPLAPDSQVSLELARANNASWQRANLAAEQARLDFRQARNSALPDLGVTGTVGRAGGPDAPDTSRTQLLSGDYPSWGLGADLSIPLPARDPRAAWQRARLSKEQAELDLLAAEQDLVLEVEAAVRAVNRDRSRLELADQTLDAAREALAADQELLDEGKGSTRNVVLSLESLAEAQVSRLAAEIDLQSSLLVLQRVEGRLLSEQRLTL